MTNGHHKAAINFYVHFQEGLLKELEEDLNEIKQNLQI